MRFFEKYQKELTAIMSERSDGDLKAYDSKIKKIVNLKRRQAYFEKHGIPMKSVYAALLDHGNASRIISRNSSKFLPRTDGLVVGEGGLFLEIRARDCFPALLYDPRAKIVGIAHLGWRGIAGNLIFSVIAQMEKIGAVRGNIEVEIGPGLCQDHFEFGAEDAKRHLAKYFNSEFSRSSRTGKVHFHQIRMIVSQLAENQIETHNISVSGKCTFCEEDLFFSCRRGDTENMSIAIGMKKIRPNQQESCEIRVCEKNLLPAFVF